MTKRISFIYPEQFLSQMAKRYWLRKRAPAYAYWIAISLSALVMCLASGQTFAGASGAFLGVLLGAVLVLTSLLFNSCLKTQEAATKTAQRWKGVQIGYTFDDDGFAFQSELTSGRCSWKMIGKVAVDSDALTLFLSERQLMSLPADLIEKDLQHFVLQKVVEAGGEVVR